MANEMKTNYREFHSADEAERWAAVHFSAIYGKTPENDTDFQQLFCYSGNSYRYNWMLRNGKGYEECCNDIWTEIAQLTNILQKHALPEPVVAYRYTDKRVVKQLCMSNCLRTGSKFADKAFFSTSLVQSSLTAFQKENACNCLLKLYLPKGLNGAYISLKNTFSRLNEQELLLQRDTEFEIIKIHRFHRPLLIECRAIPRATPEV